MKKEKKKKYKVELGVRVLLKSDHEMFLGER